MLNRLQAMARQSEVHVLQPIPTFPLLQRIPPWASVPRREVAGMQIEHEPMFYIPRFAKSLDGYWLSRAVRRRIQSLNGERPVDLIDAHFGYPDGVGCVRAATRFGIPVFVTIRGFEAERVRLRGVGAQLVNALNTATGCISVSHSLRQTMIDHGVQASQIDVIPNAVDRTLFQPASREAARARLGLAPGRRTIASVGHLIRGKRHDVLIRAYAQLKRSHPEVDLAIIGGTDYEADTPHRLKAMVQEAGLADSVRFVGAVAPAEVATWLQASEVFALATAREGCCNAVLEALATGLPVVTTPVGDNPYYVTADVSGLLAPVDDVDGLGHALRRALDRKWPSEDISRNLAVGTWQDVATAVLANFNRRLADRRMQG